MNITETIERARKAQQVHLQQHAVQLEIPNWDKWVSKAHKPNPAKAHPGESSWCE